MVYAPNKLEANSALGKQGVQNSPLQIDTEQALRQLELLGESPDKAYLTAFFPKGDPRTQGENRDKGRKSDRLNVAEIERWQAEGRGVYLVVNGGGHRKTDIERCRAIFYEHDNRDKCDQLILWQSLGLPEPTLQIDSGGKSIHSYWIFEKPIPAEWWARQDNKGHWIGIQSDLLEFADADRSLVNSNRVMRLAGAWYMKWDEQKRTHAVAQSKIVGGCEKRYSFEELRRIIPDREPAPDPRETYSSSYNNEDSLLDFRTIGHLLPHWNPNGRIGWATFQCPVHTRDGKAHSTDQIHVNQTSGAWEAHCGCDDKQVYEAVCDMVGHKPTGRRFGSTNPFNGAGGNGSRGKNVNRRHSNGNGGNGGDGGDDGDGGDGNNNLIRFPGFNPLEDDEISSRLDQIIAQSLSKSQITSIINRLALESQRHPNEIRKQYYERLAESNIEIEREEIKQEVESLLAFSGTDINLNDYLPPALAQPLAQWCAWLNINHSVVLTALLTGASSLHKTGTEIILHRGQNFQIPSTIFGAIVAPSGQKKSPIYNNIIRNPLKPLRQAKLDAYKAALADYEAKLEVWKKNKEGTPPTPPKDPTLYFFTNATGEAIPKQAAKDPDKALLALIDELSGYFNSANAYRNGRGSDKQDLLSYFDGTGQTVLRASGVTADVFDLYLSIFGTIQPEVLKQYMTDCSDPDGNHARFLFARQELRAATLPDDDGMSIQISDRITGFYRQIDNLPVIEYRLSREAFKRYQPVYNQLERLRVKSRPGMAAVYSKMEGYIGRLALNLHVLWEIAAGKECPDTQIPLFIMEMAIQLAQYYINQVKLIHAESDEECLPSHITRMIALSKRLEQVADKTGGWLKAKLISDQYSSKKRPKAAAIYEWMKEAASMGVGAIRGAGNRMEFHWQPNNQPDSSPPSPPPSPSKDFRKVEDTLGDLPPHVPKAESIDSKGVEEDFRNFRNFRNNPPQKVESTDTANQEQLNGGNLSEINILSGFDVSAQQNVLSPQQNGRTFDEVHGLREEKIELNRALCVEPERAEHTVEPSVEPLERAAVKTEISQEGGEVPKVSDSDLSNGCKADSVSDTQEEEGLSPEFLKVPKVPKVSDNPAPVSVTVEHVQIEQSTSTSADKGETGQRHSDSTESKPNDKNYNYELRPRKIFGAVEELKFMFLTERVQDWQQVWDLFSRYRLTQEEQAEVGRQLEIWNKPFIHAIWKRTKPGAPREVKVEQPKTDPEVANSSQPRKGWTTTNEAIRKIVEYPRLTEEEAVEIIHTEAERLGWTEKQLRDWGDKILWFLINNEFPLIAAQRRYYICQLMQHTLATQT